MLQSDVMAMKEMDDIKKGNRYIFKSNTINSNSTETFRVAPKAMNKAIEMYNSWKDGALIASR